MSVTALTRVRARPGGETALIAAAVRSFQAPPAEAGSEAPPRLFQGYDDPERFYWVTRWTDGALYLAGVPAGAADDWLREVCADELERVFFTTLGPGAAEIAGAVGGALVALGADGAATAAGFGERLGQQRRGEPALTQVALYPARDDTGQYLVLCGWDTEAARQQFYAETLPRYEAMSREGGGRIEPFVERTLADVNRYPRDPRAARPPIRAGRAPAD